MKEKGCKKGCKLGGHDPSLSKKEREVLSLLTKEFYTPKQVATLHKCTTQAIYKIIKKLKSKGFLHAKVPKELQVAKSEGYVQLCNQIRLHAEQFVLDILWFDAKKYRKGTSVVVDGNTVKLNARSVEVYSNTSFVGSSPAVCDSKALKYWYRLFNQLQSKFKVILLKDGSLNIRRVRAEYAETNNELAKKFVSESKKVRVYGEDGKQWLVFDNSFDLKECETVHSSSARADMEDVVQPFFNDLRKQPVLLSDIKLLLFEVAKQHKETAAGLSSVVELLRPKEDSRPSEGVKERMWYHG